MSIEMLTAIGVLLVVHVGHGSTVPSSICNSYRAIQDLTCLWMRAPTTEELGQVISGAYITKHGVEVFLGIWCSTMLQYGTCISSNTGQCTNRGELLQLGTNNGGLCTAGGQVDPQVQPLLRTYVKAAIAGDCAQYWRGVFGPCYPGGSSEIPDRPDYSMTIAQGISWWTSSRTNTTRCIVNTVLPTPPDSCAGVSAKDATIFAILDTLWSEPYGIGAHVDISWIAN